MIKIPATNDKEISEQQIVVRRRRGEAVIIMDHDVEIERIGPDPFGRNERTVFYRDYTVDGGKNVFYLWVCYWKQMYPKVPLPS